MFCHNHGAWHVHVHVFQLRIPAQLVHTHLVRLNHQITIARRCACDINDHLLASPLRARAVASVIAPTTPLLSHPHRLHVHNCQMGMVPAHTFMRLVMETGCNRRTDVTSQAVKRHVNRGVMGHETLVTCIGALQMPQHLCF